jgi:hypothetical protein
MSNTVSVPSSRSSCRHFVVDRLCTAQLHLSIHGSERMEGLFENFVLSKKIWSWLIMWIFKILKKNR